MTFVTGRQHLSQADDDPTYHCPAYRVYTSQDDGREGEQRDAAKCRINGDRIGSKKEAADRGDGGGNTPGQRIDDVDVNAHHQRCFLVNRRSTHCQPIFRKAKKAVERRAQEHRYNDRPHIVGCKVDAANIKSTIERVGNSSRDRIRSPLYAHGGA